MTEYALYFCHNLLKKLYLSIDYYPFINQTLNSVDSLSDKNHSLYHPQE